MSGADGAAARNEALAVLRLMDVPRLGPATLWTLLRRYGSADAAVRALTDGRTGLPAALRERIASASSTARARDRLDRLDALGAGLLVRGQPGYPESFLRLAQPPPVVFHRGRRELLERPGVAVIGARRCTPYGVEATRLLAGGIARADVAIVSGLARGIDGAAHRAALEASGPTIAVVGTGIDVTYPREHAELQRRVGEDGLVLSELSPGTGPRKHHFPARNRLITALSTGMIVVEAGPRSGTQATVDLALEHGLTVFAVPGPIGRPQSEGTHRMLREGAGLAASAEAVLEELNLGRPRRERSARPGPHAGVTPLEARLLDALGGWERTLDELADAAATEVAEMLPALLALELAGRIERRAGARFAAVPDRATRVPATG